MKHLETIFTLSLVLATCFSAYSTLSTSHAKNITQKDTPAIHTNSKNYSSNKISNNDSESFDYNEPYIAEEPCYSDDSSQLDIYILPNNYAEPSYKDASDNEPVIYNEPAYQGTCDESPILNNEPTYQDRDYDMVDYILE